ncbi:MAG: inorganic phosphate transporter [Flavobacteriaceae bacterium]|nr:inorganic phosphate transporter [Flavobacteriaceae bacterium]
MDNIFLLMLIAITLLAVADIVVGVSNDAINFLNSAIGSKAISMRTIMIVASLGVFIGAVYSSGLMEVARKGIFVPAMFTFDQIMFIFMAVMITDILLLDFFNTLGLPTSTTVSIVFNLLGAAVVMSLIKIGTTEGQTIADIGNYINVKKASQIIRGIFMSVFIAFSVGAVVQWISRLIFTFQFEKKVKSFGVIFGGIALTAITYFIFLKGLKGTPYYKAMKGAVDGNENYILLTSFIFWLVFSYLFEKVTKKTVLLVVITIGTFGLALAFSGNDLVNFIGVPMAAFHSYEAWIASGVEASAFSMDVLGKKVPAEPLLLFIAGGIMVVTLLFSKKARTVAETEISLSRQTETYEKFQPNALSRGVVKGASKLSNLLSVVLPIGLQSKIEKSFSKPEVVLRKDQSVNAPAFDMIRASVNLMVAGILIAIATSMKLPLSTTYVTFMVAMGTSFADRAWGRESAVYRVAGVLNVIGGWFGTAIGAFLASGIVVLLINWNPSVMTPIFLLLTVTLLYRNFITHKNVTNKQEEDSLRVSESSSLQGVIHESASNIAKLVKRTNTIYTNVIVGLSKEDVVLLKKNKKQVIKLSKEVDELRDNIFYFIKNLEESSIGASNFYINILAHLQDMIQSLQYVSKLSYKHVNNNHKKLKLTQIRELNEIDERFETYFSNTQKAFNSRSFEQIGVILARKSEILELVSAKIQIQVERTRTEESSPKNTTLYFSLLLETKDLLKATMSLLEEYKSAHNDSIN